MKLSPAPMVSATRPGRAARPTELCRVRPYRSHIGDVAAQAAGVNGHVDGVAAAGAEPGGIFSAAHSPVVGSVTVNVEPLPGRENTATCPPHRLTTRRTMDRPSPFPRSSGYGAAR